jgi:hypothetical protein
MSLDFKRRRFDRGYQRACVLKKVTSPAPNKQHIVGRDSRTAKLWQ